MSNSIHPMDAMARHLAALDDVETQIVAMHTDDYPTGITELIDRADALRRAVVMLARDVVASERP